MVQLFCLLSLWGQVCVDGVCYPPPLLIRPLPTARSPSTVAVQAAAAQPQKSDIQAPIFGSAYAVCYIYTVGLDGVTCSSGAVANWEGQPIVIGLRQLLKRGRVHAAHLAKARSLCRVLFSDEETGLVVLKPVKSLSGIEWRLGAEPGRQATVYGVQDQTIIPATGKVVSIAGGFAVAIKLGNKAIGCPVFNESGEIVGLVYSADENYVYCKPVAKIMDYLKTMSLSEEVLDEDR